MNCPVCDRPMVVFEVDDVEVDHCVGCEGTWLDAGELEILLEGAEGRDELLVSLDRIVSPGEAPRRCPICAKKMLKVEVDLPGGEAIILDKCKRHHGVWFDRGELARILEAESPPGQARVGGLLRAVFGYDEGHGA